MPPSPQKKDQHFPHISLKIYTHFGSIEKPNQTKIYVAYGTARLQGNIRCMYLRSILHTFIFHLAKRVWQLRKFCWSFIARFCACTLTSHACSRRVLCASQSTCLACVPDMCECYLGAELYRIWSLTSEIWPVDFWSNNLYRIIQTAIT